jgi:hypothetical protein
MTDRDTPGQDEQFDGWAVRWSSRRRPYFAVERDVSRDDWDRRLTELHEPVLVLTKPGRQWVEVKGQSDIDRPVMLARGMVSAMLCDAHFAREWGDEAAALRYDAEAERWHQIEKVRLGAAAVGRAVARMIVSPAGAGAKGRP